MTETRSPTLEELLGTGVQGDLRLSMLELRQNREPQQLADLIYSRVLQRVSDSGHPLARKAA